MTLPFTSLELHEAHHQSMLEHLSACLPDEGCGLLGGFLQDSAARSAAVITVENELHSPVRFRMAPAQQLKALLWLEEQGQELLAIFHSHPSGPDHPSRTDLAEFAYPESCMIIWSPDSLGPEPRWRARAFRIDGVLSAQSTWSEIPLVILPPAPIDAKLPSRNLNNQEGL